MTEKVRLGQLAYARSGDKGSSVNIGVIAYTEEAYKVMQAKLDAAIVGAFFSSFPIKEVKRYELPNLWALNFVLEGALGEGGSRSLRSDAQGKAMGQAILELPIDVY